MKKWIKCVPLLVLGLLLSTPSALGYVVDLGIYGYPGIQVKWNNADLPVTYYFNLTGAPAGASTALQNAWQPWEDECRSYMDFSYGGTTSGTGAFSVSWANLGSGGTIAVNHLSFNTSTQRLTSSRVEFNTYYTWSTAASCPPGAMDVQDIATHEFGHSLCLVDLYNPSSANGTKTMYGWSSLGETQKRTIEQDDRDGVAYQYPDNPNERVWIKDATDDYGCTPYTGSPFWESPDIRIVPDPPVIGDPATIYVTARNMMPTDQTANITVEVEKYTGVEPMYGLPYKWTNTLYSQTIPAAGNTLVEGKQEFSFPWTVTPSDFDEGHYCIVAAVQTSVDAVTNSWAPQDNDVAHHNVNIVSGLSGGAMTAVTFNAGNPTGEPVIMFLNLDRKNLPRGWEAGLEQFPEGEPIPLGQDDTLLPIRMLITPVKGAGDGEYGPFTISSRLERPGTGEQIGGGGITFRGVVGQPHDVSVFELLLPSEEVEVGAIITPIAKFANLGSYDETFPATCQIGDEYADTIDVHLFFGESKSEPFKEWKVTSSSPVTVTAIHPMDAYPENNVLSGAISVKGFADSLKPEAVVETGNSRHTFELTAGRPNPFTSATVVRYILPYPSFVGLKVYDPMGKLVKTLVERHESAGAKTVTWDGISNAGVRAGSGVYFIRFETPNYQAIQKLILIK